MAQILEKKVLSTVILYSKYTRALMFENLCQDKETKLSRGVGAGEQGGLRGGQGGGVGGREQERRAMYVGVSQHTAPSCWYLTKP